MPGLIPLMLKPATSGTRSSVLFQSNPVSQPPSYPAPHPSQELAANLPVRSSSLRAPKAALSRRFSQQVPASIPVLPLTEAEWAKAVSDVKRQYLGQRYRQCSLRCNEILDNIRETTNVEPAYLIYLHFYAATSLEATAKPLPSSSPYRNKLLVQARDHYKRASELIQNADESLTRRSRSGSIATTSSMHSPAGSISSQAWTNSTGISSPNLSIYSLEDSSSKVQAPVPVKKRVTFTDMPEPIIRPDSPTLGFDDYVYRSSPEPVHIHHPAPLAVEPVALPSALRPSSVLSDASAYGLRSGYYSANAFPSFMQDRSVHRYCGLLSSLRTQLSSHLASVEDLLASPASSGASTPAGRISPESSSDNDEMRNLEIKARIERLRQNGWQRRRFDARRYEELRESVMAELA
jgi:hypothetical protein